MFMARSLLPENTDSFVRENYLVLVSSLGRWLYYMDAIEDYEKDMKKKTFNPFLLKNAPKSDEIVNEVNGLLIQIAKQVKLLPVKRYRELLEELCIASLKKRAKIVLEQSSYTKNI